jgi:DNA-binding beta-propeller fold protein YncE
MLTQVAAGRVYDYSHSVGRNAQSGMGFSYPVAAALGKADIVYVVNRGTETISNVAWNHIGVGARVSKVTVGITAGQEEYLDEFSEYGDSDGQLIWPAGVAVDSDQNIFVSDEWLDRISVFDEDGKFLRHWSVLQSGESGPYGACGIALGLDGNLFVVGGRSHQVRTFTTDGKLLATWGRFGSNNGEFNSPWGVTVDLQGHVYVVDHLNHRVQKFTPEGGWLAQFGSYGTQRGQLYYPSDVAVDPQGDVYACDWSDNGLQPGRVHIFDAEGQYIISLIGDAQELSQWAQMTVDANADLIKARRRVRSTEPEWRFAMPTGVVFDPDKGRLVVVDGQRGRLQIYNKLKDYLPAQLNL